METSSFGPFQFDHQSQRLTKGGSRIKLQPKAAALLCVLLDRAGSVVGRDEIQAAMWPEGTYVDFDLGIKVAVKKLRDALSDRSDDPRYIQTVTGQGYRFIAPVSRATRTPAARVEADAPGPRPDPQGAVQRKTVWSGMIAAGLIAVLAIPLAGDRTAAVQVASKWILIAHFENRTDDRRLDGAMEYALERELGRSRYLSVASRDRVNDTLRLMRRPPDSAVDEDLARQIAIRDGGIDAVLTGRIQKAGSNFELTIGLLDAISGVGLAAFQRTAPESGLAEAAASIAWELRRRLNDPTMRGPHPRPHLERATTASLTALRAFSDGMTKNCRDGPPLFEEAIRADPQFASAHLWAGICYTALGREDAAAPHYEAALRLAPDASEREGLFIVGTYDYSVLKDDRRALADFETLVRLYPDDYRGVNSLMVVSDHVGDHDEAALARERLLAIRPNDPRRPGFLQIQWWHYRRRQPNPEKARWYGDELRKMIQLGLPMPVQMRVAVDLEKAADLWRSGKAPEAADELEKVTARTAADPKPDDGYVAMVAQANLVVGRIRAARQLCERPLEIRVRSDCLLRVAYALGDQALAREELERLRTYGAIDPGVEEEPLALWFGAIETAKEWFRVSPPDTPWGMAIWNGILLLDQGHPGEAADELSRGLKDEDPHWGLYCWHQWWRLALAMALEREGRMNEAIAALETHTRPELAYFHNGWAWPQCRIELAQLYRKAGRLVEAARVESEIRYFLSAGDRDHPLLARISGSGNRRDQNLAARQ